MSTISSDREVERRQLARLDLRCSARIVIKTRQYSGWIDDISRGVARFQTLTPISRVGAVLLTLPDLRPLRCKLHWNGSHNAGVSFVLPLSSEEFSGWLLSRAEYSPIVQRLQMADLAELAA
jgi:hypothetical protein